MSATVTVRGEALAPARPDEVSLTIELEYLAASPDEALREVATRGQALEAIFGELGIGRERWTTTGVRVDEQTEYDASTRRNVHRGYLATDRVGLTLEEASLIGNLMNAATSRCAARFHGPTWHVALDNPARAEARRQAALDARRRAQDYAAALGARLGAIIDIAEPGLSTPSSAPKGLARPMMTAARDAAPELTIQAGDLDVSAAVIITFALEQG